MADKNIDKNSDMNLWIARVQQAEDARKVFSIMDQFRKEEWSDEARARMSKVYMKVLERVGAPVPDESAASCEAEKNDGPVWYEKM